MSFETLLTIFLPVVLFVVLEKRKGLGAAVTASLIVSTVLFLYFVLHYQFYDKLLFFEYGLLVALGLISIKVSNPRFFKFQPVIVGAVLGGYILIVHFIEGPILLRYIPLMEKMAHDPWVLERLRSEEMSRVATSLSWQFGVLLLVHASFVAYAALRSSSVIWMWLRLAIYPAVAILALIAGFLS